MNAREIGWGVALLAAALLWAASRTRAGSAVVAEVADSIGSAVRGIRNNNPGNIRRGASAWQGMSAEQTDPAFVQFTHMRYGVRAAAKLFRNYQSTYKLRSVAELIGRWAPTVENDTGAYVAAVAKRVGVNANTPLDLANAELLAKFLRAVFRHECGPPAELIPDSTIRIGIEMA